jgi:hypothetical protein
MTWHIVGLSSSIVFNNSDLLWLQLSLLLLIMATQGSQAKLAMAYANCPSGLQEHGASYLIVLLEVVRDLMMMKSRQ